MPNLFNHADNYIKANPMSTPTHIVPEWYFLPFYAILRAISNKSIGIILFAISLAIFFFLPLFFIKSNYISSLFFNNILKHVVKNILVKYLFKLYLLITKKVNFVNNYIDKDMNVKTYKYLYYYIKNSIDYSTIILETSFLPIVHYSNSLLYKQIFWILTVVFIALGYIGQLEVNSVTIELGQDFTVLYFLIIFMFCSQNVLFLILFMFLVFIMYFLGLFFHGLFDNIYIVKNATV